MMCDGVVVKKTMMSTRVNWKVRGKEEIRSGLIGRKDKETRDNRRNSQSCACLRHPFPAEQQVAPPAPAARNNRIFQRPLKPLQNESKLLP